jgi:DNA-binding GntR family transcriptional regulator
MSGLAFSAPSGDAIGQQFRSKSSWAYETIRGMILSGDLAAGTSIDQQALATRLGISTTPLREALRRLEAEEYVLGQDHKEMRVAPPISFQVVQDLYAVRLRLDPVAAKLACGAMTDAQVRSVRSLVPPEKRASQLDYLTRNREFHRAIYAASGNPALTRVLEGLWDQCDRYRVGLLQNVRVQERSRREHLQMCDLLAERDADGLAVLTREHLLGSLEYMRQGEPTSPALIEALAEALTELSADSCRTAG